MKTSNQSSRTLSCWALKAADVNAYEKNALATVEEEPIAIMILVGFFPAGMPSQSLHYSMRRSHALGPEHIRSGNFVGRKLLPDLDYPIVVKHQ